MKRIVLALVLMLISLASFAQYASKPNGDVERVLTPSEVRSIRNQDFARAFIPGWAQWRRNWKPVAIGIWGSMAALGGVAAYEQIRIVSLQNNMQSDPSNADWYDEQIRKSTKVRNGTLIGLAGVYLINYITGVALPDRNRKTGYLGGYADNNGAIGVSYVYVF